VIRRVHLVVVVGLVVALLSLQMRLGSDRGKASLLAAPLLVSQIDAHATWYNLCNGSNGACGNCSDASVHAAWPHIDATNCHRDCPNSSVTSLSCGSKVTVSDLCPYKPSVEVEVRDCCTCDGTGGCNGSSRCSGTSWNSGDVTIDLTTTSFISLHGSLSDGRIPVRAYYNY